MARAGGRQPGSRLCLLVAVTRTGTGRKCTAVQLLSLAREELAGVLHSLPALHTASGPLLVGQLVDASALAPFPGDSLKLMG